MSDKEIERRKAKLYLDAYSNYLELNRQMEIIIKAKTEAHKILCDTAALFLGLDEQEMNRVLFVFDSISTDAKVVLGITE